MLLKSYRLEIFRPECNPRFQSLHCVAHLDQNIAGALPYLNATLGGFKYFRDPPGVLFKVHGKLITVEGDRIAINALPDEVEATKIVEWLKREINQAWAQKEHITPSYQGLSRPQVLQVLKLLPKTNCRECGLGTCMVFAVQVTEGIKGPQDCPSLDPEARQKLTTYLAQFDDLNG